MSRGKVTQIDNDDDIWICNGNFLFHISSVRDFLRRTFRAASSINIIILIHSVSDDNNLLFRSCRLAARNRQHNSQRKIVKNSTQFIFVGLFICSDMHHDLCHGRPGLCDAMKPTKGTELLKYLRKVDFEGKTIIFLSSRIYFLFFSLSFALLLLRSTLNILRNCFKWTLCAF